MEARVRFMQIFILPNTQVLHLHPNFLGQSPVCPASWQDTWHLKISPLPALVLMGLWAGSSSF